MRSLIRTALISASTCISVTAHAHGGSPTDVVPQWSFEPWVLIPLGLSALLFALGLRTLARRSARGRYAKRCVLFLSGWLVLALALVSPLHEAGERSFAAHMFEHELIMLLAAPLLVLARPGIILLWGVPRTARHGVGVVVRARPIRALWKRLTEPVTATIVQAAALWGWHSPALFDLALESETWHAVQHGSFLVSALLFWTSMLGAERPQPESYVKAAFCLFATSLISGALGALMAFSGSPWYAPYAALGMSPYGLTPAEDQQVAGLIMWIPGGIVHAAAALAMMVLLLRGARQETGGAGVREP
jgi:cytochrome c oxidase assembly factor CtaG